MKKSFFKGKYIKHFQATNIWFKIIDVSEIEYGKRIVFKVQSYDPNKKRLGTVFDLPISNYNYKYYCLEVVPKSNIIYLT